MADLTSVYGKIKWAEKHISDLETELLAVRTIKADEVVTEGDPETPGNSRQVFRVYKPVPIEIPLRIGDAVHNLRAALDHLICIAVETNGNFLRDFTGFPIPKKIWPSPERKETFLKGKVGGASAAVIKEAESLEPYPGGNDELVWCLHQLDITDKHKLLLTTFKTYEGLDVDVTAELRASAGTVSSENIAAMLRNMPTVRVEFMVDEKGRLNNGEVLYSGPADATAEDDAQFTFSVAMGEPQPLEGQPVLVVLRQLVQATSSVVERFRPLL